MSKTMNGAAPKDTTLIVDKLVDALKEIYEVLNEDSGDTNAYCFMIIERTLAEYERRYGKNSTRGSDRE